MLFFNRRRARHGLLQRLEGEALQSSLMRIVIPSRAHLALVHGALVQAFGEWNYLRLWLVDRWSLWDKAAIGRGIELAQGDERMRRRLVRWLAVVAVQSPLLFMRHGFVFEAHDASPLVLALAQASVHAASGAAMDSPEMARGVSLLMDAYGYAHLPFVMVRVLGHPYTHRAAVALLERLDHFRLIDDAWAYTFATLIHALGGDAVFSAGGRSRIALHYRTQARALRAIQSAAMNWRDGYRVFVEETFSRAPILALSLLRSPLGDTRQLVGVLARLMNAASDLETRDMRALWSLIVHSSGVGLGWPVWLLYQWQRDAESLASRRACNILERYGVMNEAMRWVFDSLSLGALRRLQSMIAQENIKRAMLTSLEGAEAAQRRIQECYETLIRHVTVDVGRFAETIDRALFEYGAWRARQTAGAAHEWTM